MAGFSKFDPNRPADAPGGAANPTAARRAKLLRWANWITLLYTAFGFGVAVYFLAKSA